MKKIIIVFFAIILLGCSTKQKIYDAYMPNVIGFSRPLQDITVVPQKYAKHILKLVDKVKNNGLTISDDVIAGGYIDFKFKCEKQNEVEYIYGNFLWGVILINDKLYCVDPFEEEFDFIREYYLKERNIEYKDFFDEEISEMTEKGLLLEPFIAREEKDSKLPFVTFIACGNEDVNKIIDEVNQWKDMVESNWYDNKTETLSNISTIITIDEIFDGKKKGTVVEYEGYQIKFLGVAKDNNWYLVRPVQ